MKTYCEIIPNTLVAVRKLFIRADNKRNERENECPAAKPNRLGAGSPALGCVRDSGGGTRADSSVLPDELLENRSNCRMPIGRKVSPKGRKKYRNPVLIRNRGESRRFFEKLARDRQVV